MRQPFGRVLEGRTLAGRYELEKLVGSGGMSVVFAGRDLVLGRPVAVKVVSLPAEAEAERDNLRERFRREAASAARIPHHPNVVQIYDYGTDPELDLDFIVMELLGGRDLKQALAESAAPPPLEEGLRILRQAARGLAAGHRVGIVHRDVKPANVFLTDEGAAPSVRLLDFGIAKPMEGEGSDSITTLGQLPHSPAYASPEQLDASRPVSPASDVYQLGLIGYELLTGERPFSEAERTRLHGGEQVPLAMTPRWSAVPATVREVIARALRRDPDERHADAAAFAEALHQAENQTILHPGPAAVPEAHDVTIASPAMPVDAPRSEPFAAPPMMTDAPAVAVPHPAGGPVGHGATRTARRVSPALWAVPALLLLALVVWAATRGRGDERPATAAAPDSTQLAAYNEEFLRLQGAAAAVLADSAAAERAAVPAGGAPADTGESRGERMTREGEEALAVQRVVADANAAWVEGDLDRHIEHYGRRVDYYEEEGASRSFVERDRRRDMRRYEEREITIRRQAVTFRTDGRARNLVDKTWVFTGDDERWSGSMRQELILEKRDGRWLIVSEQPVHVDYSRKEPI
jgi:hypothetical protein